MEIKRSLEVGDTIVCKGVKATIKEIISQDAYIPSGESGYCIDIEFRDTNGKYRNWKSYIDGGSVVYKKDNINILREATKSPLGYYYDPYCGRFGIPLDVNWFPHFGEIVVYKTEESFAKTDYIIRKRVQVKAYDSYNSAFALSNIGFNLRCNHDERHQKIVDMLLSCNGNAYAMCKRLNESKAGYTNWKVIKDDYTSQKLESIDDLGNVRYLEIVM